MIKSRGFTLIEVLVALAIFTVIAVLAWQMFNHLLRSKQHNDAYVDQLIALQQTYGQLQRDIGQTVARPVQFGTDQQGAIQLENDRLAMTRQAANNPLLNHDNQLQRVVYFYDAQQKKLMRNQYQPIDIAAELERPSATLLAKVEFVKFTAMTPEPNNRFPLATDRSTSNANAILPKAIQIDIKMENDQTYQWLIPIVNTIEKSADLNSEADDEANTDNDTNVNPL